MKEEKEERIEKAARNGEDKKGALSAERPTLLKSTPGMYLEVFYEDLEDAIINYYGNPAFDFLLDQEMDKDDEPVLFAIRRRKLTEDEREEITEFRRDGEYLYISQLLLEDMANRGLVEEGDYIVFLYHQDRDSREAEAILEQIETEGDPF